MYKNKNDTQFKVKSPHSPYIMIRENIHETLDLYSLSLYMAFRYEADFNKEDAILKRSAEFFYKKAKISRRQFFLSLNILEDLGLVIREEVNNFNSISTYHVAQELNYFNTDCGVVHDMHGVVHDVHTNHYSLPLLKDNTNSESEDSPAPAPEIKSKKNKPQKDQLMRDMIDIYCQVFPDNPQPHPKVIATRLEVALKTLIKRWPEVEPEGKPLTLEGFTRYMVGLRDLCPKFSMGEYTTPDGNKKKNGLETFCRWNTFVKFLEEQYS